MEEPPSGSVEKEVKAERSGRLRALRSHPAVQIAAVLLLPLISSLAAYKGADGKAVYAKDAGEAGFQDTRERNKTLDQAIAELQVTVAGLRLEIDELKRRPRVVLSRKAKAALPPPPVVVVPPVPIPILPEGPKNLDEALAVQKAKAAESKP